MKYTLYCEPGRNFHPGLHFLQIGDWIRPSDMIVLCHGNITDTEAGDLIDWGRVVLFYDKNCRAVTIRNFRGRLQFAASGGGKYDVLGTLYRNTKNLYSGSIEGRFI